MAERSSALLAAALLLGCGSSPVQQPPTCPDGHRAEGPACVPILDECPGPAEIPILGGGCRSVGVTACATGFASDAEGGCEPVLPAAPCGPGLMPRLGETTCVPVGVTACATGFVADGAGGCDPVLPAAPCPAGSMERLGFTTCQPIGDCGTGTWGTIAREPTTVHVDATYTGADADGTEDRPLPTLGAAVDLAAAGEQIALAAGEYRESVQIDRSVRLAGRCAAQVTLVGVQQGLQARAPVMIGPGGSGTSVTGVTLSGPAEGVRVSSGAQVILEDVQVMDTAASGVLLLPDASVEIHRSVVAGTPGEGILAAGGSLRLVDSVVKDVVPLDGASWGSGLLIYCDPGSGACGAVTVLSSVLARNQGAGIETYGTAVRVSGSLVQDTAPVAGHEGSGRGIVAYTDIEAATSGAIDVEQSVITGNRTSGIGVFGVPTRITDSVVRSTGPTTAGDFGTGVLAVCDTDLGTCASLHVERSRFDANHTAGVMVLGTETHVTGTAIVGTLSEPSTGTLGQGISAACDPYVGVCSSLEVTDSLVSGNRQTGVEATGVPLILVGTTVQGTLPTEADGDLGMGVYAGCYEIPPSCGPVSMISSLVTANADAAIWVDGRDTVITGVVARGTDTPAPDEAGLAIGILATCGPEPGLCGDLVVQGSLVEWARYAGVFTVGVPAAIRSTVVRSIRPEQADGTGGPCLVAGCDPTLGCAPLSLTDSRLSDCTGVGVFTACVDTTISGSIVQRILPDAFSGSAGIGILAANDAARSGCGALRILESLVEEALDAAVLVSGTDLVLTRSRLRQVAPRASDGLAGWGVAAQCDAEGTRCGTLEVEASRIDETYAVGVGSEGVTGVIRSTWIADVMPELASGRYGYGVQVAGLPDAPPPTMHLRQSAVVDADLAGALYRDATGVISGTWISGADFTVVWTDPGLAPTCSGDNALSAHLTGQPSLQVGITPAPAPPPPQPPPPPP